MIDRARRGAGGAPSAPSASPASPSTPSAPSEVAPEDDEMVGAHGAQLLALALAHAYRVGWLKRAAEAAVPERAVYMLKLARLCDAPRLYLRCARIAAKDFRAVELSEGWRFARRLDAALELELELLKLMEDADQRKERWARERAAQEACRQLGEAMATLRAHLPGRGRLRLRGRAVRHGWLHVPGPAAADAAFRDVQEEGRTGAAARGASACCSSSASTPPSVIGRSRPAVCRCAAILGPRRRQTKRGQDMAPSGEEGDEGEGDVLLGR